MEGVKMIQIPDSPIFLSPHLSKFKKWRPNQKEAVERIANSDKRFFILNAPTGVGKSLIAVATALATGSKTYIVTYTKQLQDQYLRDFPFIATIKGRKNYPCVYLEGLTAEDCILQAKIACPFKEECPYRVAKAQAIANQISIHNYSYYLTALNYTNEWPKADLVVLDEAHLAENALLKFVETRISKKTLDKLFLPYPTPDDDVMDFLNTLEHTLTNRIEDLTDELQYIASTDNPDPDEVKELTNLIEKYNNLRRKVIFLLAQLDDTWVIDYNPMRIVFKPTWVKEFNSYLFNHGEKFLLMSATITKKNAEVLGIPEDEMEYMELPSPFPAERRPLHFIPVVNMRHDNIKNALPTLVKLIDKVLKKHEGQKGIIHTVNTELAKQIFALSEYKRRLIPAWGDKREEALKEHEKSKDGVILSPSLDVGTDFKYDEGRFQIIVKLPFPDLSDEQTKKRFQQDKDWYIMEMANRIVQAYGRTNRAEDDYSDTYIFDERFWWYVKHYKEFFPEWFIEAIRYYRIR